MKEMGEMDEAAATLERKAGLIELEMGADDITFLQVGIPDVFRGKRKSFLSSCSY